MIDLVDRLERLSRKGEIPLAVNCDRAALARLVVELDVAWLHLFHERLRLGFQEPGLLDVCGALRVEQVPLVGEPTLVGVSLSAPLDRLVPLRRQTKAVAGRRRR